MAILQHILANHSKNYDLEKDALVDSTWSSKILFHWKRK